MFIKRNENIYQKTDFKSKQQENQEKSAEHDAQNSLLLGLGQPNNIFFIFHRNHSSMQIAFGF